MALGISLFIVWGVRYIISILTFPIGLLFVAMMRLDVITGEPRHPSLVLPATMLVNLYYSYIMNAWAAWSAIYVIYFIESPRIDWSWPYYFLGFFVCVGPIASMAAHEREDSTATNLAVVVAFISYIIFAIWPQYAVWMHGWWLQYLSYW